MLKLARIGFWVACKQKELYDVLRSISSHFDSHLIKYARYFVRRDRMVNEMNMILLYGAFSLSEKIDTDNIIKLWKWKSFIHSSYKYLLSPY